LATAVKSSSGSLRAYLITRLLLVIPMVWILVTLVFFVVRVVGDPIQSAFGGRLSPHEIAIRRHSAGLDRPLLTQYWEYLRGVLHGDFGTSLTDHTRISHILIVNGAATLELTFWALLVALIVGVPLGRIAARFDGTYKLRFHLAPPLVAERDPQTGHLQKRAYGPWMLGAFRVLAKLRRLRGTRFDLFGYTAERKTERRLIAEYDALLDEIVSSLAPANSATAVELARLPLEIRGFGHVKEANLRHAKAKEADLLARFRSPPRAMAAE